MFANRQLPLVTSLEMPVAMQHLATTTNGKQSKPPLHGDFWMRRMCLPVVRSWCSRGLVGVPMATPLVFPESNQRIASHRIASPPVPLCCATHARFVTTQTLCLCNDPWELFDFDQPPLHLPRVAKSLSTIGPPSAKPGQNTQARAIILYWSSLRTPQEQPMLSPCY